MNKPITLKEPPKVPPVGSGTEYPNGLMEDCGWLDPKGWYHWCMYGEHDNHAVDHLEKNCGGFHQKHWSDTPTIILERHGWIKLQRGNVFYPDHVKMDDAFPVTKEQFRFLQDYLIHHGEDNMYHYEFRVKN